LIRLTEPKPIRIFLQDGSNDLNIYGGNWFLANQEMLSALEFAGYYVNHIWGDGGHNGKHSCLGRMGNCMLARTGGDES